MAMAKVPALEFTCDNPQCASVTVVTDVAQLGGYKGEAERPMSGTGSSWYACKKACIAKAVTVACGE